MQQDVIYDGSYIYMNENVKHWISNTVSLIVSLIYTNIQYI